MKRILVIGSPGSGKSTFSKNLANILGLPLLHLDRIYHIDNYNQISREELKSKIIGFINENRSFIIDGNYNATMEWRMQFADTVFLLDINPDICIKNAISRTKCTTERSDMAPGFDDSIMDDDFLEFIGNFRKVSLPKIENTLNNHKDVKVIRITSYNEMDSVIKNISLEVK